MMITEEEKNGLIARAREAIKETIESGRRLMAAEQRTADLLKELAQAMDSGVGKGRSEKMTVNEIIAQLRQEGREPEADKLAALVKSCEDAREEEKRVGAAAEIIQIRAEAFRTDLKLQGILSDI